ncbi:MAG TPA: hypothetical protein VLC09_05605, partial [Polyangiaceae bacterium]|nr:hypothetical protein [Polyangiaceae bacterium]
MIPLASSRAASCALATLLVAFAVGACDSNDDAADDGGAGEGGAPATGGSSGAGANDGVGG